MKFKSDKQRRAVFANLKPGFGIITGHTDSNNKKESKDDIVSHAAKIKGSWYQAKEFGGLFHEIVPGDRFGGIIYDEKPVRSIKDLPPHIRKDVRRKILAKIDELNEKRIDKSTELAEDVQRHEQAQNGHIIKDKSDEWWSIVDEIEADDPEIIKWNKTIHNLQKFLGRE